MNVIFIKGYMQLDEMWESLFSKIKKTHALEVVPYNQEERLKELIIKTVEEETIIVGHGLGGVKLYDYLLERHINPNHFRRIIIANAPLNGIELSGADSTLLKTAKMLGSKKAGFSIINKMFYNPELFKREADSFKFQIQEKSKLIKAVDDILKFRESLPSHQFVDDYKNKILYIVGEGDIINNFRCSSHDSIVKFENTNHFSILENTEKFLDILGTGII